MTDLLIATSLNVASIFIIVLLAGLLSGLVLFGLFDQFFRRYIQEWTVSLSINRVLAPFQNVRPFIANYAPSEATAAVTEAYRVAEIFRALDSGAAAGLAHSMGTKASTLFRLPHAQLCGQLAASVSRDGAASAYSDGPSTTDLLAAISMFRRAQVPLPEATIVTERSADQPEEGPSPWLLFSRPQRERMELATSEIDHIQFQLINAVGRAIFWSALSIWTILLFLIASSIVSAGSSYLLAPPEIDRLLGLPQVLGVMFLALAIAVAAGIAFKWLDRNPTLR